MSGDRRRRTIIVNGLPGTVTSSEVESYFQSNRAGGGDVEAVEFQKRGSGCAHIVFEDEEDAVSVCKRQHAVRHNPVAVELLQPRESANKQRKEELQVRARKPRSGVADCEPGPALSFNFSTARKSAKDGDIVHGKAEVSPAMPTAGLVTAQGTALRGMPFPSNCDTISASSRGEDQCKASTCTTATVGAVGMTSHGMVSPLATTTVAVGTSRGPTTTTSTWPAGVTGVMSTTPATTTNTVARCDGGGLGKLSAATTGDSVGGSDGSSRQHTGGMAMGSTSGNSPSHLASPHQAHGHSNIQHSAAGKRTSLSRTSPLESAQSTKRLFTSSDAQVFSAVTSTVASSPEVHLSSCATNSGMSQPGMAAGIQRLSSGVAALGVCPAFASKPGVSSVSAATALSNTTPSLFRTPTTSSAVGVTTSALSTHQSLESDEQCQAPVLTTVPSPTYASAMVEPDPRWTDISPSVVGFASDDTIGRLVTICGDLSKLCPDHVEMYFDSRRSSGGGDVEGITRTSDTVCHILFSDYDSASRVCCRDHSLLDVSLVANMVNGSEPSRKIVVTNLPPQVHSDLLDVYFESSKHSGGHDVISVDMDDDRQRAVVEFSSAAVASVVASRTHTLCEHPIEVQLLTRGDSPAARLDVSGVPSAVGREELEMYFESVKRSGGGSIAHLQYSELSGMATIRFTSPYVPWRVVRQEHRLRDSVVTVTAVCDNSSAPVLGPDDMINEEEAQQFEESLFEPRMVLLTEIPVSASEELVRLYVRSALPSLRDVEVRLSSENRRAMITASTPIDIDKLSEHLTSQPLKKSRVGVRQVRHPCCARVRGGLETGMNSELLKRYFVSAMQLEVDVTEHNGTADIKFPTPQSAAKATSAVHTIGEHSVQLLAVWAGLDYPDVEDSDSNDTQPFQYDVALSMQIEMAVPGAVLHLLQQCAAVDDEFTANLASVHAMIISKDVARCVLVLSPCVGAEIASGWQSQVKQCVHSLLDSIEIKTLDVSEETYHDVMLTDQLRNGLWMYLSDLTYIGNLAQRTVTLVGRTSSIAKAYAVALSIVDKSSQLLGEIVEGKVDLQPHVHAFFRHIDALGKLAETCPDVRGVYSNGSTSGAAQHRCTVLLEGARSVVSRAVSTVRSLSSDVFKKELSIDDGSLRAALASPAGQRHITGLIGTVGSGLDAMVYVSAKEADYGAAQISLVTWKSSASQLKSIEEHLDESCATNPVPLSRHEAEATCRREWQDLVSTISQQHVVQVETGSIKDQTVTLHGLRQELPAVRRLVSDYMAKHAMKVELMPITLGQERFINAHLRAKVGEIKQQFGLSSVSVENASIRICGNIDSVKSCGMAFSMLVLSIRCESLSILRGGMGEFFASKSTQKTLRDIEQQKQVMVECSAYHHDELHSRERVHCASHGGAAGALPCGDGVKLTTPEGMAIVVRQGSLTTERCDAVVCASPATLDLNHTVVGKALLKATSARLQDECHQRAAAAARLAVGDIVVTDSHGLPSGNIMHCVGPFPDRKWTPQVLHQVVLNCLLEASRLQMTSIAFPSLGAGKNGLSASTCATQMFNATMDFSRQNSTSALAEVVFTVFAKTVAKSFREATDKVGRAVAGCTVVSFGNSVNTAPNGGPSAAAHVQPPRCLLQGFVSNSTLDVCLVRGDITAERANAVIVPVGSTVDVEKGSVLPKVLEKAGASCLEECRLLSANVGPLEASTAFRVGGGNYAQHLILSACPTQGGGVDVLQGTIENALEEADLCQSSFVVLPAVGSGNSGFSPDDCATAMARAIQSFTASSRCVKGLRIVLFNDKLVESFAGQLKAILAVAGDDGGEIATPQQRSRAARPDGPIALNIYGVSHNSVQAAKQSVQAMCDDGFLSKAVSIPADIDFAEQCGSIVERTQSTFGVHVELSADCIMISGASLQVMKAHGEILDNFAKRSEHNRMQKHAASVSQIVEWSYTRVGTNTSTKYDHLTNMRIEEAHRLFTDNNGHTLYTLDAGLRREILFPKMEEWLNGRRVATVTREDFTRPDTTPKNWDLSQGLLVVLNPGDAEYEAVSRGFRQTCQRAIAKIERIQNKALYAQYQAKKAAMEANASSQHKSGERRLYHGTASATQISTQGFNRSFAGRNAVRFGRGAYFALHASYSERYALGHPKQMFQAMVLVGEYSLGTNKQVAPPPRRNNPLELMDTTVNHMLQPTIYVTYHDAQTYPEYLITFT